VLIFPDIVDKNRVLLLSTEREERAVKMHTDKGGSDKTIRDALRLKTMRVDESTDTDHIRGRSEQQSGANLVCLSPGVVFAADRNTCASTLLRRAQIEVITIVRTRRPGRRPLHDVHNYSGF
jgi:arginine deiminase